MKTWEVQLDLMLSYNVQIPPFGLEALGSEVVRPVFEAAKQHIIAYARSGMSVARYQPQLLSNQPADYSARFPVRTED